MDRGSSVPVVVSLVTMIPREFFLEAVGDEGFPDATSVKTNVEDACFSGYLFLDAEAGVLVMFFIVILTTALLVKGLYQHC